MSNSLNLTFIQHQRSFDQSFSITGGAGVDNLHTFRKLTVDVFDRSDGGPERIPVIVVVERTKQRSVLPDKRGFRRR